MRPTLLLVSQRVASAVVTVPAGVTGWLPIFGITAVTTFAAGVGAVLTGFIQPKVDFSPPQVGSLWRPLSAFLMPGLLEELMWRAALIPTPAAPTTVSKILYDATNLTSINPPTMVLYKTAIAVLFVHVSLHPVFSDFVYPRGRGVFSDPRFLFLATIVLGGTTISYIVSGGSVWAAAFTHGLPVALWRDFFSGEDALQGMVKKKDDVPVENETRIRKKQT